MKKPVGYNNRKPEPSQKIWGPLKEQAQNEMTALDLDITFYNVFNKINNNRRIQPERYLVCFVDTKEKRALAIVKARELGYSCCSGKSYTNYMSLKQEFKRVYSFKIDLDRENITK
jgi:hypothetical protein